MQTLTCRNMDINTHVYTPIEPLVYCIMMHYWIIFMEMRVASQLEAIIFLSFINSLDTCRTEPVFNIQQNKTLLWLKGLRLHIVKHDCSIPGQPAPGTMCVFHFQSVAPSAMYIKILTGLWASQAHQLFKATEQNQLSSLLTCFCAPPLVSLTFLASWARRRFKMTFHQVFMAK